MEGLPDLPPREKQDVLFDNFTVKELYNYSLTNKENREAVTQYLREKNYDPKCLDAAGRQGVQKLLELAVKNKEQKCVAFALDYGAELTSKIVNEAARSGFVGFLKYVVRTDGSLLDYYSITNAIEGGNKNILDYVATTNARNWNIPVSSVYSLALSYAYERWKETGQERMLNMIDHVASKLECYFDPNMMTNICPVGAIYYIINDGNTEIFRRLISGFSEDFLNASAPAFALVAASNNNTAILDMLKDYVNYANLPIPVATDIVTNAVKGGIEAYDYLMQYPMYMLSGPLIEAAIRYNKPTILDDVMVDVTDDQLLFNTFTSLYPAPELVRDPDLLDAILSYFSREQLNTLTVNEESDIKEINDVLRYYGLLE